MNLPVSLCVFVQSCASDGTGAVLPHGHQVLYGTQTPAVLHHAPLHGSGSEYSNRIQTRVEGLTTCLDAINNCSLLF